MITNEGHQNVGFTEEERSGSQGSRPGRKKYNKLVGKTFVKEVLLLCLFGMALPTVDVYSDGALIIQLYVGIPLEFRCLSDGKIIPASYVKDGGRPDCSDGSDEGDLPEKGWKVADGYQYEGPYEGHPIFATVLSIPLLLSFVFLIPHWYQTEKTSKKRWMTLPLLLLQVWPQYRILKLLIILFQDREDQQKYHEKKAKHDKDITCLEPYVEAVPTVLILLALVFRNNGLFGFGPGHFGDVNFLGIRKSIMFITTFSISVFSGSFGMAKFLKLGPCQIVPSQAMHCGFFFVMISMATALVSKGCVLAFSLANKEDYETFTYPTICLIWISSCILPQFILAMVVFIKTCGFKNTAKLVWQYPAMILTPIFSFWTMGPKKTASTNKSCCRYGSSNDMRIGVSYLYTFLNCFLTISGSLFCLLITHQKLVSCSFFESGYCFTYILGIIVMTCLLIIAIIFTLVLKCKKKSVCWGVALSNEQHFDINEWDVIEVEQEQEEDQAIEMTDILAHVLAS